MPAETEHQQLLKLARSRSLLRESEIRAQGLSSTVVSRAVAKGHLERLGRGLYRHPEARWDEHLSLSEVAARAPHAVVVLVSALQFHQIGTHQAHSVWIQLRNNGVPPRISYPPIEVVKTGIDEAFSKGVKTHHLNDIDVRITTPARTVVDCFKYRRRVGLELCLEALKDLLASSRHRTTPAEIMEFAKLQRVSSVIQPYVEALS
ncbi:MAG: type IV toxin-antitoxin system AbiEi family antitoxin domain-containing protein [Opitutales bacterium]|nr:type IV toxin-antitoxin system AbiEi family antitoxin domain-containing protein [Opitutales bacterium]